MHAYRRLAKSPRAKIHDVANMAAPGLFDSGAAESGMGIRSHMSANVANQIELLRWRSGRRLGTSRGRKQE
jgi:hypothetical protein